MPSNAELIFALHHAGAGATVQDLMPIFDEEDRKHLSARLCQLRTKGYCLSDYQNGKNLWTLTEKGIRTLQKIPKNKPENEPAPELMPEPEFVSQIVEDEPDSAPDPIARDVMQAMELDLALDDVRRRLRAPVISARAARVYRDVIQIVPPAIQEALKPITQYVIDAAQ